MKCAEANCSNMSWEGSFKGEYCSPCYDYYLSILDTGVPSSVHSQAYRNAKLRALEVIRDTYEYEINTLRDTK